MRALTMWWWLRIRVANMSNEHILENIENGILTVTFNRPEKYNALTQQMVKKFSELVMRFRDDEKVRVMLINARGKYYSAGVHISNNMTPDINSGIAFRDWNRRDVHLLLDEIEAIEKPIISAAQGPCLGGALEMALSCDFRLASESAAYSLPEINIGILPGNGGISRLVRLCGIAQAKWLVMGTQTISAQHALQAGLVHAVYEDDIFVEACHEFASHLVSLPTEVIGLAKLAIDSVYELDRATARNIERIVNTQLFNSEEHKELVQKFIDRKK